MELNTSGAFFTAAISAIIGFGLAFFIQDSVKKLLRTKVQNVLLLIASISIGFGLMGVLNELIGFPLQGLKIRVDKVIGYSIINVLILPGVLALIIWLIQPKNDKTINDRNLESHNSPNPTSITDVKENFSTKKILLIGVLAIIFALSTQFSNFIDLPSKDKIFKVSKFQSCDAVGSCKDLNLITKFKVEEKDVIIFADDDKGKEGFFSIVNDSTKCTIIKEMNFAFSCLEFTQFDGNDFWKREYSFDGKHTFSSESNLSINNPRSAFKSSYSKSICKVE